MTAVPGAFGYARQPGAARRHGHLWSLPDGTGLHAPPGRLVAEEGTGRLCCHLCGEWFVSLGIHVRVHGHTAGSYRAAMSLPRATVLAAPRAARPGGRAGDPLPAAAQGAACDHGDGAQQQRSAGWTIILRAAADRRDTDWARLLLRRAPAR